MNLRNVSHSRLSSPGFSLKCTWVDFQRPKPWSTTTSEAPLTLLILRHPSLSWCSKTQRRTRMTIVLSSNLQIKKVRNSSSSRPIRTQLLTFQPISRSTKMQANKTLATSRPKTICRWQAMNTTSLWSFSSSRSNFRWMECGPLRLNLTSCRYRSQLDRSSRRGCSSWETWWLPMLN